MEKGFRSGKDLLSCPCRTRDIACELQPTCPSSLMDTGSVVGNTSGTPLTLNCPKPETSSKPQTLNPKGNPCSWSLVTVILTLAHVSIKLPDPKLTTLTALQPELTPKSETQSSSKTLKPELPPKPLKQTLKPKEPQPPVQRQRNLQLTLIPHIATLQVSKVLFYE